MTALGLQTPQHIIKRDGHLADFDPQKIWSAIYRCMISDHESAEVSGEAATTVAELVLRELAVLEESPSVEEVQDLVERTLWHSGYQAGALAYIRYREMRRLLREEKAPKKTRKKKAAEPGATFRLEEGFVQKYRKIPPPWGFGVLSELTFLRTYARPKPDGTLERWFETIRRVVEGTYRMQERHIKAQNLGWNEKRAQKSAQEMYERMFWMKFLPPGRGLWAMGSVLTEERALFAALNNCGFASTEEIDKDPFAPFLFLMDMSMLGVGVGFDTFGTGKIRIVSPGTADTLKARWKKYYPLLSDREETVDWEGKPVVFDYEPRDGVFVIPDTREGWVISALYILDAFFTGASLPRFDCSQVRPAGLVIKGFGGLTSGPGPLIEMHRRLIAFLTQYIGGLIDSEVITTLMNLKGKCVVSGNVRRTAEIAFGLPEDRGFLALKDYRYNAETGQYEGPRADRAEFGYTSNNSVFATLGMDYRECADRTRVNGEPGYAWLENMRAYGRMVDPPDHRDKRVKGGNPCLEQSLESWELCCLVETFIARHESLEEYRRTLKFAYLYAKTVTLGKTHWAETNKVMLRNRRIGCSMSGVQQFVAREGLDTLRKWCEAGYKTICDWDRVYSEWLCVPESIKKTSLKPSGTVSLLAGATPGMHWPENVCYLRRINVPAGSPLLPPLEQAGYPIEPNVNDPTSMIVAIPVKLDVPVRPVHQVSIWEQVAMAAFLQRYWADNQVSCLTAETLIHTNRGLVRIGDLHSHLEMSRAHFGAQPYNGPVQVLDEGGEWKPISHLIINPPSPIIKVQMEGGQCLRGTLDHKVRVLGESLTLEWKTLSSIRPGDYLLEKLGRSSYGSAGQLLEQRLEVFRREVKTCGHKEARVPGQVTAELGEFLGYMVSDGHLGHTNAAFGLTQQNNNVVPRFQELVRGLFNLDTHICEDLRSPGLLQVGRSSVLVNDWLRFVGLYDEENKKRVPWPIMAAGERTIKAFLRGITLDGHVCKESGRVVVTTTNSYRLAEEVCELLKVVGFQPSIFQSGPGGERTFPHGQTYQSGPCWNVSLSADQSCRFVRMIGFAEERKTQEYQEFGDKQRRSLFGGVPDFGLREKMSDVALRCTSRFLKDHFHSASLHAGKEVSRESLLQLFDMGEDVPDHLLDQKNAYRRVIAVAVQPAEVTFDLTVPESHSYLSNGFVSHNCTVTFDPETEGDQIERVLEHFQYSLKGISLLPKLEAGAYAQMPYEEISEARYQELAAGLKPVQLTQIDDSERELEQFCDGNACLLPAR